MTCIVGLEYGGRVLLAGDIQATGSNNKIAHPQPKVFIKQGVTFGFSSSFRFGQILEHCVQDPVVPENEKDIYRWLILNLIPDIQTALEANDFDTKEEDNDFECLVGVKNQLWVIQGDFSVLRAAKGYNAIGAGTEYAFGSVFTSLLRGHPTSKRAAENILRNALAATALFCPSVGSDCYIIST